MPGAAADHDASPGEKIPGAVLAPFAAKRSAGYKGDLNINEFSMADYYSLIQKAVARLDPDAPTDSRRALYERARAAQLNQLRSISPSLTKAEITREQLALEEAVRRVESETIQRARDVAVPGLNDLVAAADEIGKAAGSRATLAQPKDLPNPSSPNRPNAAPPMIVTGGATGRLIRYWRWRPLVRSNVA